MVTREVISNDVKNTLINPFEIKPDKVNKNGISRKYIGNRSTVVINPATGNIITTWKSGEKIRRKYDN